MHKKIAALGLVALMGVACSPAYANAEECIKWRQKVRKFAATMAGAGGDYVHWEAVGATMFEDKRPAGCDL